MKATTLTSILIFTVAVTILIRETQERLVWRTTLPRSAGIALLLVVNEYKSRFRGFPRLSMVALSVGLPQDPHPQGHLRVDQV